MPFETAWDVSQNVTKELGKLDIDSSALNLFNKPKDADVDLADLFSLKNPICAVLSNRVLVDCAKTCFTKCTYKSLRIDQDTWESEEARSDFIPAVYYVLLENLSPFFKNLTSFLPTK
jgi:hypothetical protein